MRWKILSRKTRGSATTEFSISATLVLLMVLSTVELSIELFIRQSVQRESMRIAMHYAETRSKAGTDTWISTDTPGYIRGCFQPIAVRLYNNAAGVDMSSDASGFLAQDNGGDLSAVMARVHVSCEWTRVGPLTRTIFGPTDTFESYSLLRLRD